MTRDKSTTLLMLCCAALVAFHCGKQSSPDTRAEDESAIRNINLAWFKAYKAGDANSIAALYANDAVMNAPGAPAARGQSAIREYLIKDVAGSTAAGVTLNGNPNTEIGISGDLAWEWGTFTVTDTSGATVDRGKYVSVFERRDGKWLVIRDIWNSDGPMQVAGTK
jgi:uncharacterized protein (TIGR02246 family)